MANYLSTQITGLDKSICDEISQTISGFYPKITFDENDIESIITLLKYDKKNSHGIVYFVLLEKLGNPVLNQEVSNELIYKAFDFYKNLSK